MKGSIHFHSNESYDSMNSIDKIIDKAMLNNLDFIILTDHDTIEGSMKLRKRVKERGLDLIVPIAAEYKTEFGDIIAAFISKEIHETDFESFVKEVLNQEGLLMLPHPFEAHSEDKIEFIGSKMHLIETFNGRCNSSQDLRSKHLSKKLKKPEFFGSDAHLQKELFNVIVSLKTDKKNEKSLKKSLLDKKMQAIKSQKTFKRYITISQIIKGLKRKNIKIVLKNIFVLAVDTIRLGWSKKID